MRCFRYHSSKNNQSRLHWLYPSAEMNTHLATQSPTLPLLGQVQRAGTALFTLCQHPAVLGSKHLSWHLWALVTLHSSWLAFSITSTDAGVPYTRPSSGDWLTTNPSSPKNVNRYLQHQFASGPSCLGLPSGILSSINSQLWSHFRYTHNTYFLLSLHKI